MSNGTDQRAQQELAPLEQAALGKARGIVAALAEAFAQKPAEVRDGLHEVPEAGCVGRRHRPFRRGRHREVLEGAQDAPFHPSLRRGVLEITLHECAEEGIDGFVEDSVGATALGDVEFTTDQVAFRLFYCCLDLVNQCCLAASR